jgi:hypothetical protein
VALVAASALFSFSMALLCDAGLWFGLAETPAHSLPLVAETGGAAGLWAQLGALWSAETFASLPAAVAPANGGANDGGAGVGVWLAFFLEALGKLPPSMGTLLGCAHSHLLKITDMPRGLALWVGLASLVVCTGRSGLAGLLEASCQRHSVRAARASLGWSPVLAGNSRATEALCDMSSRWQTLQRLKRLAHLARAAAVLVVLSTGLRNGLPLALPWLLLPPLLESSLSAAPHDALEAQAHIRPPLLLLLAMAGAVAMVQTRVGAATAAAGVARALASFAPGPSGAVRPPPLQLWSALCALVATLAARLGAGAAIVLDWVGGGAVGEALGLALGAAAAAVEAGPVQWLQHLFAGTTAAAWHGVGATLGAQLLRLWALVVSGVSAGTGAHLGSTNALHVAWGGVVLALLPALLWSVAQAQAQALRSVALAARPWLPCAVQVLGRSASAGGEAARARARVLDRNDGWED